MSRIYAALAIIIILIIAAYYVYDLAEDLTQAKADNAILKIAINTQNKTIKTLTDNFKLANSLNAGLRTTVSTQQKEIDNLNKKFHFKANGQSRDLGGLARAKPGLINEIINNATDNANRCFELATGAPKQKGEQNNECKELITAIGN